MIFNVLYFSHHISAFTAARKKVHIEKKMLLQKWVASWCAVYSSLYCNNTLSVPSWLTVYKYTWWHYHNMCTWICFLWEDKLHCDNTNARQVHMNFFPFKNQLDILHIKSNSLIFFLLTCIIHSDIRMCSVLILWEILLVLWLVE